jgi:hypothetical protein
VNYPAAPQMHSNSIFMFQQVPNAEGTIPTSRLVSGPPRSLKSSSSSDSFKSAISEQEPDFEIIREVEGVLHAFRTALEVLEKVMKRIDEEDKALRIEAEMLNYSLTRGLDIDQAPGSHQKKHGKAYLRAFRDSQITIRQLQEIMDNLMGELVTNLHMYSAAYEVLSPAGFQKLYFCSEKCRINTLFELDRLAMLLFPRPLTLILLTNDLESSSASVLLQKSEHEVYVAEDDIDQRLSADYDHLLRGVRRPAPSLASVGRPLSFTSDMGLYETQPANEATRSGALSSPSSGDEGFGLTWDSRASTLALPEMNDIAPPTVIHPIPATQGRSHIQLPASPPQILPPQQQQGRPQQSRSQQSRPQQSLPQQSRPRVHQSVSDQLLYGVPPQGMHYGMPGISTQAATMAATAATSGQGYASDIKQLKQAGRTDTMAELSNAQINRGSESDAAQPGQVINKHNDEMKIEYYSKGTDNYPTDPQAYFPKERLSRTKYRQRDALETEPYHSVGRYRRYLEDEDDTDPDIRPRRGRIHAPLIEEIDDHSDSEIVMANSRSRSYTRHRSGQRVEDYVVRKESTSAMDLNRDYVLGLDENDNPKMTQKYPATFQCNLCSRRFKRAYNLRAHMNTHTDERPFACTVCGKEFVKQVDLKLHEGDHSTSPKKVSSIRGVKWEGTEGEDPLAYRSSSRSGSETDGSDARTKAELGLSTEPVAAAASPGSASKKIEVPGLDEERRAVLALLGGPGLASRSLRPLSLAGSEGWTSSPSKTSMLPIRNMLDILNKPVPRHASTMSSYRMSTDAANTRVRYSFRATTSTPTRKDRFPSTTSTANSNRLESSFEFDDGSGAEGAAGLEAMGLAEERYRSRSRSPSRPDALSIYQMRLMLLEQRNKKRLLMASVDNRCLAESDQTSKQDNPAEAATTVREAERGHQERFADPNDTSSTNQSERLWRLAYMSLNDTQPDVLQSLNSVLNSELDFDIPYGPGSETKWSSLIPGILSTFNTDQDPGSGIGDANDHRKNIMKVIEAVSGSLGLENSALAWWCVTILLRVCTTAQKSSAFL